MNRETVKSLMMEAIDGTKEFSDVLDIICSPLERSNEQRYLSLENAFKTIDAFEMPSTNPEMGESYDELKKHLLSVYSKDLDMLKLNNLKYAENGGY